MSNEELMKPRYKVIADYPGNDEYPVGSVKENIGESYCKFLDEYPHLFKKLEWWEERSPEEMPQYLKVYDEVKKVKMYGWFRGGESAVFENEEITKYLSHCIPATEEEYNNQNNTSVSY